MREKQNSVQEGGAVMEWTPLPVGVENFREMIEKGYYYVDKTLLIKDLIDLKGESVYTSAPFWKDSEYEYAPVFF